MELHYIVLFTVLINSVGGIIYIKNTLLGKTKPNKMTWVIWAAAPLIGTVATIYSQGLIWSVLPVFMAGFIPLCIFISSFINKNSYWELHKLDYLCGAFAIGALVGWFLTADPLLAIIFAVIADLLAAIPLLLKMYHYPETETIGPFIAGLIANSSAFLVVQNWVLEEVLFPGYLVIICILLITTYYIGIYFKKNN